MRGFSTMAHGSRLGGKHTVLPGTPDQWGRIKNNEGDVINDHMLEVEQRRKKSRIQHLFNNYSLKMANQPMDGLCQEVWSEFSVICPYDDQAKTYLPTYNNELCKEGNQQLDFMIRRALGYYL